MGGKIQRKRDGRRLREPEVMMQDQQHQGGTARWVLLTVHVDLLGELY